MKEIKDIIQAYERAAREQLRMALATVVMVEGSSYRRPGARMLVTEEGQLTGAISGGCLEGNALQKALLAIHQQRNKLVTYDTSDEEDGDFAVQLGCNGIVHILFEPIDTGSPDNPVALLEKLRHSREEAVIVTLFSLAKRDDQPGTSLIACGTEVVPGTVAPATEVTPGIKLAPGNEPPRDTGAAAGAEPAAGSEIASAAARKQVVAARLPDLAGDIQLAKREKRTFLKKVAVHDFRGEALIEYIAPAVSLVIAGAGNDVKPLVEAGAILGWELTVMDGRAGQALPKRFPKAKQVICGRPDQVMAGIEIDPFTAFVLMTHNYEYDLAMLRLLIGTDTPYIGSLGPKTKLQRMYRDLTSAGIRVDEKQKARIYGPAGLDIGAETPEEIAVSIIAEIKAVFGKRSGGSLRLLTKKMHEDIQVIS